MPKSMCKKVVVTDYTFPDLSHETAAASAAGVQLISHQCKSPQEVVSAVDGADLVLVQFATVNSEAIAKLAEGAAIVRYGIGFDNIDLKACSERGITVGYVPDYCADEVADHASACILAMLRKLPQLDASVRRKEWSSVSIAKPIFSSKNIKIGFFGFGSIGRMLRSRLEPFGFSFAVTDPGISSDEAKALNVDLLHVDELFRTCDVISLHAPSTPQTNNVVNAERLATMKSNAIIVNTSRGSLIDEAALAEALTSATIGGAALDVFAAEPLSGDSPLRAAPNLLMTPHAAWYSEAAIDLLQKLAGEDVINHFSGRPLRKLVPQFGT